MPNAGLARKLAGAKVPFSLGVAAAFGFAEQAVYEDELTHSPLNSLDGLLGNAAVTKQSGYRPGLRLITCGSIASRVWSRRQKWW